MIAFELVWNIGK